MSLAKYLHYKDSGTAWLGEVPSHWTLAPLWTLFSRTKRTGYEHDELLSVYRDYGVIPKASRDDNNNKPSDDLASYQLVMPGDLVINKMKAWQGSVAISDHRGIVSPAYFVYKSKHTEEPRYLHYLMRSPRYITGYLSLSKGIRVNQWDLEPQYHSRMPILLPPREEQAVIATFLDRETGKIDALIAEQEKLLELLAEKRQATISHAVTRGLNPYVSMKDSGVEWLGKIPAHWKVTRLKFVATVQTGIAKGKDTSGKETINVPYLRVANVQDGFLALADIATIDIEPEQLSRYRLLRGDVLMNEGGDFDKLGRGAIWSGEIDDCIHQNHVFAVRPHGVSSQWLNQVASSRYAQFHFMGRSKQSTNLASISSTNVMELPLVLPPESEQETILNFTNTEVERLSRLKSAAQHAIELLKERRSALISAAVTGKIDVRNELPQELAA
ncbi:type I restriction endonuclease subunit S [Burkholderia sp. AU28863]|uniref:restriction endonuclease subunit S n=1 Tax=Burkholderia sp. AU28863 TaxID=2015352 RepID=UPI000B7A0AAC|nr:restriction endonuclease subunit S [Burkholderia sp. AU28863]OXI70141.1 type I restriction endonuclease subunit S [Burkholderia sp. AU28863]